MKKSIATRWVKALRSGKYTQGKTALKDGDDFCCLGVLCDIYDKSGWSKNDNYKRCDQGLHKSVLKWSGMTTHSNATIDKYVTFGLYESRPDVSVFLVVKNDNEWSFKRIATWIEENYKKL